ncbi:5'-nucleotidase domain-containing protein 1 isoform X2 [Spea bombifrons]|uniref:5'-nucleotidase domain-containing protein 1 isoform X2 n=1 Tax=Spea bombifrons TaxID=233779 RepID=UPI00234B9A98|nr:5'-nucleotidase domain-containing protein 1 isoform X2 [Spea bombifrons]
MTDCFSVSDCDIIGFDLDHTLCQYKLRESNKLIYDSFAQYLVAEKGYSEELLSVAPEEWDFCSKGLVLDLEKGNFLKLGADGTILRACHGTKTMSAEQIEEAYGEKREWKHFKAINGTYARSAKYYFYDNYFDLPGALLCAKIVDTLETTDGEKTFDFWKDMISAIEHNYKTSAFKENCGTYFPAVKRDPSKYLKPCPESVKNWIRSLKNAGKVLLLITSSHSDYCRLLCEHIIGKDFEEMFDIIITNALKPGFFSLTPQQRPFWTLENDVEIDALPSLKKSGWYSQGNWIQLYDHLKTLTGKPEPKVVYFGDSMRSDIFSVRRYSNWEAVLVLEELEGDEVHEPDVTDLGSSLKKKGKYDSLQHQEPYFVSNKWGSYFADTLTDLKGAQETPIITWCCASIMNYSTIAIPSIKAIVDLPLDYKFTRFSSNNSDTDGYYPQPPKVLLLQKKEGAAA